MPDLPTLKQILHTADGIKDKPMETDADNEIIEMLSQENLRLRKAGSNLCQAALHVVSEYDGLHRLALAVSEFSKALADEHGRGDSGVINHGVNCEKKPHDGSGYLHAEDDDGPYDVDGCTYCGRCHSAI